MPIQHAPVSRPADKKPPKKIRAEQHPAISHFKVGARAAPLPRKHDIQKDIRQQVAEAPVNMDRKSFQNLRRGKLKPEGRIDLHGMPLAEAHPAFIGFVMSSHRAGKRLVLVLTGQGKHTDGGGRRPAAAACGLRGGRGPPPARSAGCRARRTPVPRAARFRAPRGATRRPTLGGTTRRATARRPRGLDWR